MKLFRFILPFLLLTACNSGQKIIQSAHVDPLEKVLPDREYHPLKRDTLRAARGEVATLQIVLESTDSLTNLTPKLLSLRCGKANLSNLNFWWEQYVCSSFEYQPAADDNLAEKEHRYPDPLIDDTTETLFAGKRALLWVEIPVPQDAEPGLYRGKIAINATRKGKSIKHIIPFSLQVYPVTLPTKSNLRLVNWTYDTFSFMNAGQPVERYSPLYWDLLGKTVDMAKAYRQDTWLVRNRGEVSLNADSTDFCFDFTAFDLLFSFFLERGNASMICGPHFVGRPDGWENPMRATLPVIEEGKIVWKQLLSDDPDARKYLIAYFSALSNHLKSKSLNDGTGRTWFDIYAQHIGDEPQERDYENWNGYARLIKEAAPDMRIMEAYESTRHEADCIDILVPQIQKLETIQTSLAPNQRAWFYTCMFPRGNYANRFVNLPLIKTRILHWVNFKYKAPGYLHWGLNAWSYGDLHGDISVPKNGWPGGDAYIIYPGYQRVYPSIRLAAMRDGVDDYNLLMLAAERDPAFAQDLAEEIILNIDSYNTDLPHFREIRKQLLEFLSKK